MQSECHYDFPRVSKADAKTLSSDEETMSLGGGGGGYVTPLEGLHLKLTDDIIGRSVR
jgi:hypothetical protein